MARTLDKRQAKRDVGYHDRRLARRLQEDPEFRAEFNRQRREIAAIDAIVNQLDALRESHRMSKAELARAIDKNPAAVRRLLTASGNPELRTVVAMAQALGADVKVVPKRPKARPAQPRKVRRPQRSKAARRTRTPA
jgi:DNA-binding phage protein